MTSGYKLLKKIHKSPLKVAALVKMSTVNLIATELFIFKILNVKLHCALVKVLSLFKRLLSVGGWWRKKVLGCYTA